VKGERVDLLIVGSGPAGLSAAIQAARDGLHHLVLGKRPHGGLILSARLIENLPGFPHGIPGPQLAELLLSHAERFGVRLETGEVLRCRRVDSGGYVAELTDGRWVCCGALIVATGTMPKHFDCQWGQGVSYSSRLHRSAWTLPQKLDGQVIAVVGGGEAALDTALNVADRGGRPRLVVRAEDFRARGRLVEHFQAAGVETLFKHKVQGLALADHGLAVFLEDGEGRAVRLLCSHVVICVGRRPCIDVIEGVLPPGAVGDVATGLPGLYLAGDLIRGVDRYAATAIGDGQRAARLVRRFLNDIHDISLREQHVLPVEDEPWL
jgi:thioredoxin reductase (NADPH)